MDLDSLRMK